MVALGTGERGVVSRRQIIRSCKARGWTVQPDALNAIENSSLLLTGVVGDAGVDDDDDDDVTTTTGDRWSTVLEGLARHIQTHHPHSHFRTVTEQVWNEFAQIQQQQQQQQQGETKGRTKNPTPTAEAVHVEVINAFDTPKLVFEVMRKQFQVVCRNNNGNKWSLFGTAEDKINMLAQRYALIHQRILRHDLFRTSDLHRSTRITARGGGGGGPLQITPIESLLGAKGTESTSSLHLILILGILLQIEEGVYYFEDPTGQVPVSFQQAVVTDASFVTEHSILLVEGHFQDGILHVHRLGQPLQESRETAIRSIQQQVSHPAYTLPKINTGDTSFVILQDVYADQPRVLQQLEGLLATFENHCHLDRLPLFVLTGNFCSPHLVATAPLSALDHLVQSAVDELCTLVAKFPRLAAHAHFCFVPGPNDSLCRVLPFPPLPHHHHTTNSNSNSNSNTRALAHCHWASNPCRIRWNHKEMVVFRYNLLPLLQQHQIRLPFSSSSGGGEDDLEPWRLPHCRLLKTVLDQGHLMPVASVPVYWNYSHALALYPLPDCLVVASGSSPRPEYEPYWDCHVIQTTPMFPHGAYAIYRPGKGETGTDRGNSPSSASGVSHDHGDDLVEFGTLGEVDVGTAS